LDDRDNDGDGKTRFSNDPGCPWPAGDDENEAACSDGRDKDGDGKTDLGHRRPAGEGTSAGKE
jgi:hypothetical protein